jgi:hypothetical protein
MEMRNVADGSVVWNKAEKLENILDLSRENIVFNENGDKFAYTTQNKVVICNPQDGTELKRIPVLSMFFEITNVISGLSFSKDNSSIYASLSDGTARKYTI